MPVDSGRVLREARLEKGWARKELAFRANVAERTVYRIERGKEEVSEASLRKVATALDVPWPLGRRGNPECAVDDLGGYSRSDCDDFIGSYEVWRPAFVSVDKIVCSICEIYWRSNPPGLRFTERTSDREHRGDIRISKKSSNFLHLVSFANGDARLMTLSAHGLRSNGQMIGVIQTKADDGIKYIPAASSVVFLRMEKKAAEDSLGIHDMNSKHTLRATTLLREIVERQAIIIPCSPHANREQSV